jgi:Concanavalin A-like lectin/glucanases superfamily
MNILSRVVGTLAVLVTPLGLAMAQWHVSPSPASPGPVSSSQDRLKLPGLVGYWAFDNCLADDLSEFQRTTFATISNLEIACNDGVVGKAYRFRGVEARDHLLVENTQPLVLSAGYSINLWFRLQSNRSWNGDRQDTDFGTQVLISKSSDRTGISLRLEREQSDDLWYAYLSNGRCCARKTNRLPAIKLGGGVKVGDWHMITSTFDPKRNARLYLDGKAFSSVKASEYDLNPQTDQEPLTVAAESAGQWYPFNGDIDEVRVYNRPVSVVEIAVMFAQRNQRSK